MPGREERGEGARMAMISFLFAIFAAGTCVPAAASLQQVAATPMQKVVTMLSDMMAKGKAEKQEELVAFAAYSTFCKATSKQKESSIEDGRTRIEKLEADIAKKHGEIEVTREAIEGSEAEAETFSSEKSEAEAARKKEAADYAKTFRDYSTTMAEISNLMMELNSKAKDGQEASLVEKRAAVDRLERLPLVSEQVAEAFKSFLQEDEGLVLKVSAREASSDPVWQSSGPTALEVLEQLGEKFKDKRNAIEKDEMTKAHAFNAMDQSLTNSIKDAKEEAAEKTARLKQTMEEKAQAQKELGQKSAEVEDDTHFLADLRTECAANSVDFEKRQNLRQGEIQAIQKAMELLSGAAVSGATRKLPSLVQRDATSLAQFRSNVISPMQKNAAAFLQDCAEKSHSQLLSLAAMRLKADPLKKVSKMIRDMITKLTEEATEEAEHKGFCDTEMGTNKQTRDTKTDKAEELTAQAAKLTTDITGLEEAIATLGDEIAEIDAAMSKAIGERQEEKAKNGATIAEAHEAAEATRKAIAVLRDFYNGASEATALAQFRQGAPFGEPYKGTSDGTGILPMLEVVEGDFKRLESATLGGEEDAELAFKQLTTDSSKSRAVKTADMSNKQGLKSQFQLDLQATQRDLRNTNKELSAANAYFEKLKPSCVEADVSYEDRVEGRDAEIESLQEALKILGG